MRATRFECWRRGSQLLVTTTHQSDVFDRAWWSRWLPRGGRKIEEYLARGPYLEITDTFLSKTHRFTLYRRRIVNEKASSARK